MFGLIEIPERPPAEMTPGVVRKTSLVEIGGTRSSSITRDVQRRIPPLDTARRPSQHGHPPLPPSDRIAPSTAASGVEVLTSVTDEGLRETVGIAGSGEKTVQRLRRRQRPANARAADALRHHAAGDVDTRNA